jgi:pSer/pThr/pTyr-binding forkhead associated (FHA) protein
VRTWQTTLEVRRLAGSPEVHAFQRPRIAIGAAGAADLLLPGDAVSSPHCELRIDAEGRIEVADLGSRLGTRVNGRALTAPAPLAPGDELAVADYAIRLVEPPRALEAPAWQLTFDVEPRGGGARETKVFRQDQVWIGRGRTNDIALPKGNASRRHCYVAVRPDGVAVVVDSGSTNGTFVNGRLAVGPTPLSAGDKIYVGDHLVTLARPPERIG